MMVGVRHAVELLSLVIAVAIDAGAARRAGLSAPLVLVLVGVIASLLPGVPEYRLDPEVALIGVLPPLFYAAALRTSASIRLRAAPVGRGGSSAGPRRRRCSRVTSSPSTRSFWVGSMFFVLELGTRRVHILSATQQFLDTAILDQSLCY
jgi:hypothetical protein